MTVIELTRQLGAAIQEDARYKEYEAARKTASIGKFDPDAEINVLLYEAKSFNQSDKEGKV